MKKLAWCFFACLVCLSARSQWSTNGTTVYYNSGNVGIGTATPGNTALSIYQANTDGGATLAPCVWINNTSTFNPTGSGYNLAWMNLMAGNGAVIGQLGSGYGVGGGAPWNGGSGFYINTRTDHPIVFATGATTSEKMRITASGNVGIGTTSPNTPLQINGSVEDLLSAIGNGADRAGIYAQNTNSGGQSTIYAHNDLGTFASYCGFLSGGSTNSYSNLLGLPRANHGFFIADGPSSLGLGVGTLTAQPLVLGTNNAERMRVDGTTGNVSIGTTNAQGYKLAVNGSAIFTAAWVKPYANWPDYVFKRGYRLPSLNDVSGYIRAHHHLPDMPSAGTVAKKGIDLGNNQVVLLKKIEELTLYLIEQDKTIQAYKEKFDEQEQRIERLEKLIKQ